MNHPLHASPSRWRLPLFALLGAALLIGSFTIAALALPLRADDISANQPAKSDSLADRAGRKTVVSGMVDTREGVTAVLPLQPGKVVKVTARENQEFDEGAPLYVMDDHQARFDRDTAKTALDAAQAQLEKAKKLPDQQRAAIAAQQAVISVKENNRDAAQKNAEEARRLSGNGVSAEKAAAAQKLADAAAAAVEAENQNLKRMELEDPEIAVKLAEEDVGAKRTQLAKVQWALDETTVKAPYKGKVLRMQVTVGDSLPNPRQAPVLYCSNTPRIVRAEVEQEFAAKVYVGQLAKIKDYSAEDQGEWKGKVESISDWYTHRRSMILEPLQFNDVRTLEAIIELDAEQKPLKIGQRVRVTLPLAPQ